MTLDLFVRAGSAPAGGAPAEAIATTTLGAPTPLAPVTKPGDAAVVGVSPDSPGAAATNEKYPKQGLPDFGPAGGGDVRAFGQVGPQETPGGSIVAAGRSADQAPHRVAPPAVVSAPAEGGITITLRSGERVAIDRIVFGLRDGSTVELRAADILALAKSKGDLDLAFGPGEWGNEDSGRYGSTSRRGLVTMSRSSIQRAVDDVDERHLAAEDA